MTERTTESIMASSTRRKVQATAEKLEQLAARLRDRAARFESPQTRYSAVSIAADIVGEYVQGVGNGGVYLNDLIAEAVELDTERARCADEKKCAEAER
jgi:hypothetical protein